MWFGLLFFAGVTSSLAMGQPIVAFFMDEFHVTRGKATLLFGGGALALGFLCVWLYPGGSFDEFDFWTGTFALVVFALAESFIFAYVFGIDRGWEEITRGADMHVPRIFRFVIKYVTPTFILLIFVGAMIKPSAEWGGAFSMLFSGEGWPLASDSVIGRVLHTGVDDYRWIDEDGRGTRYLVQDFSRVVLALVFVTFGLLIAAAWRTKGRRKEGA
jgi:hypothetical protein